MPDPSLRPNTWRSFTDTERVALVWEEFGVSIEKACKVCGVDPATLEYDPPAPRGRPPNHNATCNGHIVTQAEICAKLNALTPREFFLVCNGGALPERMLGLQGKNGALI